MTASVGCCYSQYCTARTDLTCMLLQRGQAPCTDEWLTLSVPALAASARVTSSSSAVRDVSIRKSAWSTQLCCEYPAALYVDRCWTASVGV